MYKSQAGQDPYIFYNMQKKTMRRLVDTEKLRLKKEQIEIEQN